MFRLSEMRIFLRSLPLCFDSFQKRTKKAVADALTPAPLLTTARKADPFHLRLLLHSAFRESTFEDAHAKLSLPSLAQLAPKGSMAPDVELHCSGLSHKDLIPNRGFSEQSHIPFT